MSGQTTRRGFLGNAAAASGCLAIGGLSRAARAAEATQPAGDSPGRRVCAPLIVVTPTASREVNPRAAAWTYITEILRRAGVFFQELPPAELPSLLSSTSPLVLLPGDLPLASAERDVLKTMVERGGALVGIGGTSGLDKVFGVSSATPLAQGWIKVTAPDHPITAGLRSSLHVFGGCVVKTASAASLASLESDGQGASASAIVENRFGKGRAVLLAPDLLFSIVHIQQGVPVLHDGKPAPDGSAPLDEGSLKAEDGLVLDWQRDRTPMQPDGGSVFLEPVSDELRELILRSIFHTAAAEGIALPVLWYWPRGLKAVGHISHDSDGNDPQKAAAMLEVVRRCGVKSTWCTLYPGGYPAEFYRTLKDEGFEIALHYDAKTAGPRTSWSKANFVFQHEWLMKEVGLEHIVSNKNHYTRWEGRLDFYRWCEEVGIESDQTRGPSKKGTIGFPLGGSQPYFPLDDEADRPRFLNVFEVNMLTQDLVVVCPAEYGRPLLDSATRHHGVAHFLFHPAHILKPGEADVISGLVDYGREEGLEWWTNGQIVRWEKLRRGLKATFDSPAALTLRAAKTIPEATLLFLRSRPEAATISINGRPASAGRWSFCGFEFDAVTSDIAGEADVRIA